MYLAKDNDTMHYSRGLFEIFQKFFIIELIYKRNTFNAVIMNDDENGGNSDNNNSGNNNNNNNEIDDDNDNDDGALNIADDQ